MSAYIGVQPVLAVPQRPETYPAPFVSVLMPRFDVKPDLTPTQFKLLNAVRQDIRAVAVSAVQPIHTILASSHSLPAERNTVDVIIDELAPLKPTALPLVAKASLVGAGLVAASLFATSNIFASPNNIFGGMFIGIITLIGLPIIDVEFTDRALEREFKLIPLEADHLPSLETILDKGYTAEQFGKFVEQDLLPRVPIGHFRSKANGSGTCLHDIMFWARDNLHFPGTTWQMIHKVIEDLHVGKDISLRVKTALLVIERDTTLNEASLPEINAALAELAGMPA
jgi:hypothetical protein